MKRLYQTLLLSLLVPLWVNAQTTDTQSGSFSLEQCIVFAMENNPNLKSAKASISASEAKVGEYIATGLPQINANADLGNNYIIPTSFLPAKAFDPNAPEDQFIGVQFGTKYSGRASITLDQMLFNGSYFVGLKASRTYTELARKDAIISEVELTAAIKKAYYSVLVNTERLALVEKNFSRLDTLLIQTRAMYNNGFAEKIDVNRVQVQYNNMINAKRNTTLGVEVSLNLLKFQMGLPISSTISLTDNLQNIKFQVFDEDFKKDFTYSNRVEFSKLEVNHSLIEMDIKNTKAQYLPSLDLYGNYGTSYGSASFDNFIGFGENWKSFGTFGLRASLPIFDGLRKSKQLQQKRIQLSQIENSLDLTKNQIDMEQLQSTLAFENSLEIFRTQKENMELAEEVYKVAKIKYQEGVGSNIEVIDADASYKEAQTNYYSALYDALITSVDLEKSYGKLIK